MHVELPFDERVDLAVVDDKLQTALDRSLRNFTTNRRVALGALPEVEVIRDHGRAIRAEAIAHLDKYLLELEQNVIAAGGKVHWARNGEEACQIVLDIAKAGNVQVVAKGKSMVSEEIGLNHALEHAGLKVVETDLGEFIIQLSGETPSHIIAPVIHKRKEDVAQVFHEKLGMPLTDDVGKITATARTVLREQFLAADMGITGVNFGVAETGTIVLCTNEGNGRLCSSLPRIHVAMMGIERVVPTMADLTVLLQVLARSATGQKLTVYTSFITGPRRLDEPDGPEAFHLVLVDNGRARIVGTEMAESLYCIRCGACLNACPVYRSIGGHAYGSVYSGPIGAVITPALDGIGPWGELPHASSLCGACQEACPVRIDLPRMLLALRAEGVEAGQQAWYWRLGMKLWRLGMMSPARFRLGARLASFATRLVARKGWVHRLPPPLSGWTESREFPAFPAETFHDRMKRR